MGKTIARVHRNDGWGRLLFEFTDGTGLFLERQRMGDVGIFGAMLSGEERCEFAGMGISEWNESSDSRD